MAQDSKTLLRQWQIIQLLLSSRYVSTTQIENHLKEQGIQTTQRTVQRDLHLLKSLFPLECRQDSIPYGWRWKRVEQDTRGLNISQAAILRLVDEQLRDVLPDYITQELEPLFQKAKFYCNEQPKTERRKTKESSYQGMAGGNLGWAVNGGLFASVASAVSSLGNLPQKMGDEMKQGYRNLFDLDSKAVKQQLKPLAEALQQHDLADLAVELQK